MHPTSCDAVWIDRTLFRSFDENADGTVSQHEFRKGIENLGIVVTDDEFAELMETLDEVHHILRTRLLPLIASFVAARYATVLLVLCSTELFILLVC